MRKNFLDLVLSLLFEVRQISRPISEKANNQTNKQKNKLVLPLDSSKSAVSAG